MNRYKIFPIGSQTNPITKTYNNNAIERLYVNEQIEVGKYHLASGSVLYIDPTHEPTFIKTFVVLSGRIIDLETKREWFPGDVILIEHLDDFISILATEESLLLVHAQQSTTIERYEASTSEMIALLTELQNKDNYTKEHSDRVFKLSKRLALSLGYHSRALYTLNKAARFHDIGKVYIPDAILNKPSKLDSEEYKAIQAHVSLGKELILKTYNEDVYAVISQHHERWDGSGYPLGLKGKSISEAARILAICDSFDAMTTDRVYGKGKTVSQALDELIALAGIWYDPDLVEVSVKLLREDCGKDLESTPGTIL